MGKDTSEEKGSTGADPVGWIGWLATPPLSLKLRNRTKLSLRRFCLGLFRYSSVRSAPPPPPPPKLHPPFFIPL